MLFVKITECGRAREGYKKLSANDFQHFIPSINFWFWFSLNFGERFQTFFAKQEQQCLSSNFESFMHVKYIYMDISRIYSEKKEGKLLAIFRWLFSAFSNVYADYVYNYFNGLTTIPQYDTIRYNVYLFVIIKALLCFISLLLM